MVEEMGDIVEVDPGKKELVTGSGKEGIEEPGDENWDFLMISVIKWLFVLKHMEEKVMFFDLGGIDSDESVEEKVMFTDL
ncbi:hypothetical protein U1Q18_015118, partial [Sarracenia purpurea var. burkii]